VIKELRSQLDMMAADQDSQGMMIEKLKDKVRNAERVVSQSRMFREESMDHL
jgi:hypothetical protein